MRPLTNIGLLVALGFSCCAALAQQQATSSQVTLPSFRAWDKYLDAIASLFSDHQSEEPLHPTVSDTKNFSGIPTALIDLNCCGAYTDEIYVVQLEKGKPVKARFRAPGDRQPLLFLQGASTMHFSDTQFNAKWNAVVATSWDEVRGDDGIIGECRQDTYVWSAAHKRFDWTQKLSYHRHAPNCGTFDSLHNNS